MIDRILYSKQHFIDFIYSEHGQFLSWGAVCYGVGISLYFSLDHEPSSALSIGLAGSAGLLFVIRRQSLGARMALLMALGFASAHFRAWFIATPMLDAPLHTTHVQGTIKASEFKADGRLRLTIQTHLLGDKFKYDQRLALVRVSFRAKDANFKALPGCHIRLRARLLPLSGAIAPHSYDFRRQAYFQRLSATGFALGPPTLDCDQRQTFMDRIEFMRTWLTHRIHRDIDGQEGAVAAALVTGDRTALSDATQEHYSRSGLAHILSISGLHFSLVAGFVFFIFRRLMSLSPHIALRWPTKKIAAIFTIFVAIAYLLISGSSIPVIRSFLMIGAAMTAILIDRNPFSMRLVAFAAMVILVFSPESLLNASFQLSFAAVIALVATFEYIQQRRPSTSIDPQRQLTARRWATHRLATLRLPRGVVGYFTTISLTTLVAGMATAPLTAMIFNRFPVYSLLANLLAIPLTGFWIMPCLILYLLALPLGLDHWLHGPLMWGVQILNAIAETVSSWPLAVVNVSAAPSLCLVLFALGGLWLCLWQRSWRWWGTIPCVASVLLLWLYPRDDRLYLADDLQSFGLCRHQKLWVYGAHPSDFTTGLWARHCGAALPLPLKDQDVLDSPKETSSGRAYPQLMKVDAALRLKVMTRRMAPRRGRHTRSLRPAHQHEKIISIEMLEGLATESYRSQIIDLSPVKPRTGQNDAYTRASGGKFKKIIKTDRMWDHSVSF